METLTMIIYVLLIMLISVSIAIGIRLIITLHKVDELLENVNDKVHSLDRLFEIVDLFNDKMSMVGDAVVGFLTGGLKRVFKDRKKRYDEEEEE